MHIAFSVNPLACEHQLRLYCCHVTKCLLQSQTALLLTASHGHALAMQMLLLESAKHAEWDFVKVSPGIH